MQKNVHFKCCLDNKRIACYELKERREQWFEGVMIKHNMDDIT